MDGTTHVMKLGKLVGNFHSLEFVVRLAIKVLSKDATPGVDVHKIRIGDAIPADAICDYDSLGRVIDRYNALVKRADQLDRDALVTARDMLAHGRVCSGDATFPLRLVKFGREQNGQVLVEALVDLDEAWFDRHLTLTMEAIKRAGAMAGATLS